LSALFGATHGGLDTVTALFSGEQSALHRILLSDLHSLRVRREMPSTPLLRPSCPFGLSQSVMSCSATHNRRLLT
jgi:hypothetical protein